MAFRNGKQRDSFTSSVFVANGWKSPNVAQINGITLQKWTNHAIKPISEPITANKNSSLLAHFSRANEERRRRINAAAFCKILGRRSRSPPSPSPGVGKRNNSPPVPPFRRRSWWSSSLLLTITFSQKEVFRRPLCRDRDFGRRGSTGMEWKKVCWFEWFQNLHVLPVRK